MSSKTSTKATPASVLEVELNPLVEGIYIDHINAGMNSNSDSISSAVALAELITSKTVTSDAVKVTMSAILKDTKIKTVTIKPNHVQSLPVFAYVVANVEGAHDERVSSLLTLAVKILADKGVKGFKSHIATNGVASTDESGKVTSAIKNLNDATKSKAESQAENSKADTLDAVAVVDITLESALEAFMVFLKANKDIKSTDKPLLKSVIANLIAIDKASI